jgi:hypothetical protein
MLTNQGKVTLGDFREVKYIGSTTLVIEACAFVGGVDRIFTHDYFKSNAPSQEKLWY